VDNLQGYDRFTCQLVASQRRLYSYILTLVPSLTDANDVLQNSNVVILAKRQEYQPDTEFGAWACRVAYFEVLAYRRRKAREHNRLLFAADQLLDELAGEAVERYGSEDDAPVSRLERCMSKLSDTYRELIRLRYHNSLSSEEIAANTGRSASAVRQLLYRVRTQLLSCMQREERQEEHP
jgi:RNA polymerase sigma-70 factor (ECF subfamily)